MICGCCGTGEVIWVGPFSALTHTECQNCGAINSQLEMTMDRNEELTSCRANNCDNEVNQDKPTEHGLCDRCVEELEAILDA